MEQENNNQQTSFKSYILLTATFILSIAVAICMLVVDSFCDDINQIIVWAYVAVISLYSIVAIIDVIINKEKKKNLKIYIISMVALNVLATAFLIIAYLNVR